MFVDATDFFIARQLLPIFEAAGLSVSVEPTLRPRHATQLASLQGWPEEYEAIIVVGGDGLINEVQNGNLGLGRRLPIAIVPAGK